MIAAFRKHETIVQILLKFELDCCNCDGDSDNDDGDGGDEQKLELWRETRSGKTIIDIARRKLCPDTIHAIQQRLRTMIVDCMLNQSYCDMIDVSVLKMIAIWTY